MVVDDMPHIEGGVSVNGGTPKNTPKWSFLVEKPMVVGYHHFWKHPRVYEWFEMVSSLIEKTLPFLTYNTCEGKDNFYWNHKETNHTIVVKLE